MKCLIGRCCCCCCCWQPFGNQFVFLLSRPLHLIVYYNPWFLSTKHLANIICWQAFLSSRHFVLFWANVIALLFVCLVCKSAGFAWISFIIIILILTISSKRTHQIQLPLTINDPPMFLVTFLFLSLWRKKLF